MPALSLSLKKPHMFLLVHLHPLPSSWEQFQASQMTEVRHMEQGLAVPVTSAKTNLDGPTPRYLSKHSQSQQICRGATTDSRCIGSDCSLLNASLAL